MLFLSSSGEVDASTRCNLRGLAANRLRPPLAHVQKRPKGRSSSRALHQLAAHLPLQLGDAATVQNCNDRHGTIRSRPSHQIVFLFVLASFGKSSEYLIQPSHLSPNSPSLLILSHILQPILINNPSIITSQTRIRQIPPPSTPPFARNPSLLSSLMPMTLQPQFTQKLIRIAHHLELYPIP